MIFFYQQAQRTWMYSDMKAIQKNFSAPVFVGREGIGICYSWGNRIIHDGRQANSSKTQKLQDLK